MIFCFEAQHGEFNAAIRNVRNALAVLREDFAVKKDKYKHITRPLPLPEPEYEILATLIRLDQGFVGYSTEITDSNDKRIKNSTYLDFSYVKETFEVRRILLYFQRAAVGWELLRGMMLAPKPLLTLLDSLFLGFSRCSCLSHTY